MTQCCPRDHDHDGDCDIHATQGVMRRDMPVGGGVLLPWVSALPLKMQSVLLSALRGPDTHHAPHTKRIVRWLRPATQRNADPTTEYMRDAGLPAWADAKSELEFSSVHYFGHLMEALEIVSHRHPDLGMRFQAWEFYVAMCDLLHVRVEDDRDFERRFHE